jgi:uncharacterized protein
MNMKSDTIREKVELASRPSTGSCASTSVSHREGGRSYVSKGAQARIWIDLDNSPHVPFFMPIIDELRGKGHEVILTARNSYQVCELLDFHQISCDVIGRHWGKNEAMKILGTCTRALHLAAAILPRKPDLAVAHGSRSQVLASKLLGIPSITLYDYEFTQGLGPFRSDWVFLPNCVSDPTSAYSKSHIWKYPGLKEDVYVPRFQPDPGVRTELGLMPNDIVVTMRPAATEAHYHNPESQVLFDAAMKRLILQPDVRIVLLPRSDRQAKELRETWAEPIASRKVVIPERVLDGLNVIWFSDLVISGGGTMNREAAALGIPVYSVFRGRIGAVDRYLAENGRLVLLENIEDVQSKIAIERRRPLGGNEVDRQRAALPCIVQGILSIAERGRLPVYAEPEAVAVRS